MQSQFSEYCNSKRSRVELLPDSFTLAGISLAIIRHWLIFSAVERIHLVVYLGVLGCRMLWARSYPARYVRFRHFLAVALRVGMVLGPGTWKITTLALQVELPSDSSGKSLAFVAATFLFGSTVVTNCGLALARSVQLPLNVTTQAVVLACMLSQRKLVCSTPFFQGPAAGRLMSRLWRLFSWTKLAMPLPLTLTENQPSATPLLCSQVLGVLQVWVGFLAPVVAAALLESSSYLDWLEQKVAEGLREQRRTAAGRGRRHLHLHHHDYHHHHHHQDQQRQQQQESREGPTTELWQGGVLAPSAAEGDAHFCGGEVLASQTPLWLRRLYCWVAVSRELPEWVMMWPLAMLLLAGAAREAVLALA